MAREPGGMPAIVRRVVEWRHLGKAGCIKQHQPEASRQHRRNDPITGNGCAMLQTTGILG